MKILFNDLSELEVQAVEKAGDRLEVKTISATPAQLREYFEDPAKTRKMKKIEGDAVVEVYEGFTKFYCTSEYPGVIYGVVQYKPEATPEAEEEIVRSAVKVAKIQAQDLTDEEALDVQNLYPEWDGDGHDYTVGYKVNYDGVLYKCLQAHTSQESWNPADAASLWAKVINEPGTIPEWEQPSSTNGYMTGDKVTHNEKVWVSLVDNNVWEPGTVGTEALWEEVA